MVVLEAMAAGNPVVAVDAPGVRDVVIEGENGYLVPEGDLDGFVARSVEVLSNPAEAERLSLGGRDRARELSLARTTKKVEELYRWAKRQPAGVRDAPFAMLQDVIKYHFNKLGQEIDDFLV